MNKFRILCFCNLAKILACQIYALDFRRCVRKVWSQKPNQGETPFQLVGIL